MEGGDFGLSEYTNYTMTIEPPTDPPSPTTVPIPSCNGVTVFVDLTIDQFGFETSCNITDRGGGGCGTERGGSL